MICEFDDKIFNITALDFNDMALELFRFQYQHNELYRRYTDTLHTDPASVKLVEQIPFLPISFFKSHAVITGQFEAEVIFESSGTTQTVNSRHLVKNLDIYRRSFRKAFEQFYGSPGEWCILALLPAYLERQHSSLVLMADDLIRHSGHPDSGFYLYNFAELSKKLEKLEAAGQKTLLLGVTFALLDFAEAFPMPLKHTVIMETGGMKGRKQEMIREEVHAALKKAFEVGEVHSEYGMTELLSQAYSKGNGLFECPPWMKILLREEDDPLEVKLNQSRGVINVIDLANIYSCCFIATDDAGRLHPDGRFEVLGRVDNSDIRGCSLMAV